MKKVTTILSLLAISLTLSSVSYAGNDPSPGKKATTIESVALIPSSYEAVNLVPVYFAKSDVMLEQPAETNMIVKKCEALPVAVIEPAAVNERWRKINSNYAYKKMRSTGQKFDSTKFSDRHRRLCNIG